MQTAPEPAAVHHPVPPPPPGRKEWWIGLVGSWILWFLALTLRIRVENPEILHRRAKGDPFILVFWHNRLLLVPVVWNRFFIRHRLKKGMALTSTSRDGELIAQFLDRFGIGPVRGSATKRGAASIRELLGFLKRGHDIAITPDGSRGPLYEIKPGLVLLAQLTGKPVLPISFEYSRAWRLRSWDRFFIPKPFSTVRFIVGEPHTVQRTSTPEDFEVERRRCEEAIMAIVEER